MCKNIIKHATDVFGDEILSSLSFLEEHAKLDIGHTKYNRLLLSRFLEDCPQVLDKLIDYGCNALDTYGRILTDYNNIPLILAA